MHATYAPIKARKHSSCSNECCLRHIKCWTKQHLPNFKAILWVLQYSFCGGLWTFSGLIELVDHKACAELSSSCISYLHEPNYSVGSSGGVQFVNAA